MRRRAVHYCLLGNILTPLKIKLASASFRQSFYFFRQKWDEGYSFFEEEEDEQTVNNPETPDFQSWVDLAWFFFWRPVYLFAGFGFATFAGVAQITSAQERERE